MPKQHEGHWSREALVEDNGGCAGSSWELARLSRGWCGVAAALRGAMYVWVWHVLILSPARVRCVALRSGDPTGHNKGLLRARRRPPGAGGRLLLSIASRVRMRLASALSGWRSGGVLRRPRGLPIAFATFLTGGARRLRSLLDNHGGCEREQTLSYGG